MPGLANELYQRCRETLLKCSELDSDASLRNVFVTEGLHPFRDRLPAAASKSERVDTCLALLVDQRLSDGQSVLALFLQILCDRYNPDDALHVELEALVEDVLSIPEDSNSILVKVPAESTSIRRKILELLYETARDSEYDYRKIDSLLKEIDAPHKAITFHLEYLEHLGYIEVKRETLNARVFCDCRITFQGIKAFEQRFI